MKVIILTIAVALITTSSAYPRRSSYGSNGNQAAAKVEQLGQAVTKCFRNLKDIATNDNEEGGAAVSEKLDTLEENVRGHMHYVNNAIADRDWVQAKIDMGEVKAALGQVQGELELELSQLSPKAAANVRKSYGKCFKTFGKLFGEIFRHLGQALG